MTDISVIQELKVGLSINHKKGPAVTITFKKDTDPDSNVYYA